jgi:hypothetical protein
MSLADFLEFNLSHDGQCSDVILRCRKEFGPVGTQMFIVTTVPEFQAPLGAKEKFTDLLPLLKEL